MSAGFSARALREELAPNMRKKAVALRQNGHSYEEIADRLCIAKRSVDNLLSLARRRGELPALPRVLPGSMRVENDVYERLVRAARQRDLLPAQLIERLVSAASECIDAVLDDRC